MSEQSDVQSEPTPAPQRRDRFVDRLWGLRALIAVALASVIIGGVGGAAIAKAGSSDHGSNSRFGPGRGVGGFGGFGRQNGSRGPGGPVGQPPQQNGQQQTP